MKECKWKKRSDQEKNKSNRNAKQEWSKTLEEWEVKRSCSHCRLLRRRRRCCRRRSDRNRVREIILLSKKLKREQECQKASAGARCWNYGNDANGDIRDLYLCIECERIFELATKSATQTNIKWKIYCVIWRVQANTRRTTVLLHGIHMIKYQGIYRAFFSVFMCWKHHERPSSMRSSTGKEWRKKISQKIIYIGDNWRLGV